MLEFDLRIANPFRKKGISLFEDYVVRHWQISQNKCLEIQISKDPSFKILFEVSFALIFRGEDHAGPEINLSLLPFFFHVKLYDYRHWDHEADDWEKRPRS